MVLFSSQPAAAGDILVILTLTSRQINIPPQHTMSLPGLSLDIRYLQGESKKRVISKDMTITPLKSIRKGKSWCVSENSYMLQDRHHTFQIWWKNGLEKWTWSWQPPSINGLKFTARDMFHFYRGLPSSSSCSQPFLQYFWKVWCLSCCI